MTKTAWFTILVVGMAAAGLMLYACGGDDNNAGFERASDRLPVPTPIEGSISNDSDPAAASGFVGDGVSRGVQDSVALRPNDSFAGLLGTMEVAVHVNQTRQTFEGRLRNEAEGAACDIVVTIFADASPVIHRVDGLRESERATFDLPLPTPSFTAWNMAIEHSGCTSVPSGPIAQPSGESGAEGGGESGGGDGDAGHTEGSDPFEQSGSESASESNPTTPLTERSQGTFFQLTYDFGFDTMTGAFRGTVTNPSATTVCRSRTEIHLNAGGSVVELGPTIPVDMAQGQTISVVMFAPGVAATGYSLHPESSPCPTGTP